MSYAFLDKLPLTLANRHEIYSRNLDSPFRIYKAVSDDNFGYVSLEEKRRLLAAVWPLLSKDEQAC
ncbi:MAG: hypothetical protein K2X27_01160, partial [Candidatus Obscuribacterales bacterium]|nr:hypothetical protein [Candidatus Obscuribacterales bacterium]